MGCAAEVVLKFPEEGREAHVAWSGGNLGLPPRRGGEDGEVGERAGVRPVGAPPTLLRLG